MKPYGAFKGEDYCCEIDDGPYNKFKKKVKRYQRHKARQKSKQEIKKILNEKEK